MDDPAFGRYRLRRLIGSGGMGDVYEALDTVHERAVALKLLPPLFSGSAEFQERFRRESRVAARLREPHIIPIHDFGEIDGRLFLDMRLVDDGVTLATLLRDEGALPPARAVDLIAQVADALDAAHADGLVHRDVKPSNVLITPRGFVYVVDFGIAHAAGHTASRLTMSGATVGTLAYMAPERFDNRGVDARADVYSLACLLHECLAGRAPFEGVEGLPALMYAHLHGAPPAPSAVVPGVPGALDDVVAVGMAKRADHRFATAGALADAARRAVAGARLVEVPGPRAAASTSDTEDTDPTGLASRPRAAVTARVGAPLVPGPTAPPAGGPTHGAERVSRPHGPGEELPFRMRRSSSRAAGRSARTCSS